MTKSAQIPADIYIESRIQRISSDKADILLIDTMSYWKISWIAGA